MEANKSKVLDYIDSLFEKDFEGYTQLDRKFKNKIQECMQREWKKLRQEIEFQDKHRMQDDMNNPNWVMDFLKSLDEVQLKELLITVALITDPLSQELMKKASLEETKLKKEI